MIQEVERSTLRYSRDNTLYSEGQSNGTVLYFLIEPREVKEDGTHIYSICVNPLGYENVLVKLTKNAPLFQIDETQPGNDERIQHLINTKVARRAVRSDLDILGKN